MLLVKQHILSINKNSAVADIAALTQFEFSLSSAWYLYIFL